MPSTDAYGNPGAVAAGELIESAWGNAAASHVVRSGPISARPATPHVGAVWYATDNKLTYVYHATNGWVVSDWNQPWGLRSVASVVGADAGNGAAGGLVGILVTAAFTGRPWVAGRKHRITFDYSYSTNTPNDRFNLEIHKGSGTGGTLIALYGQQHPTAITVAKQTVNAIDTYGDANQWTFCINRTTGGVGNMTIFSTSSNSNYLTVDDIGPITPI